MNEANTYFAPQLYIKKGIVDLSFYEKAFGAIEIRRWTNDDNSVHVAELSIDGAIFQVHEEKLGAGQLSPQGINGTTVLIGLFVSNVDEVVAKAIEAGATLTSPIQSYDYGYEQGVIRDPFGHLWMIEKKI
ncbi:MAG TPA: VOC family protein [Segetibacter sp.]|nr:VOC family protein [Segetibacter sp.]